MTCNIEYQPKDPTVLFQGRVENYVKYRPTYSPKLLEFLQTEYKLLPEQVIADIGSGTGILTELFLQNGNFVFAVEPNLEMRQAAEEHLAKYRNFTSVAAQAEATTLPDQSIDMLTAGQSFHWFERNAARQEFRRILKPGGWVVLIWNLARTDTPFLQDYNRFWQTDLQGARGSRQDNEDFTSFFAGAAQRVLLEGVHQDLDLAQFTGRVLSISMAPKADETGYAQFVERVQALFEHHQHNGVVRLSYDTEVVIGKLTG